MKFLTMKEILQPCVGQDWAVGAYDTCNLETTQAIFDAALADEAPIIVMIYPGHTPQQEWLAITRLIEAEVERTGVPTALVLDHAKTIEQIEAAVKLGFSGVMIDASLSPLEQNIAITRRAVELAHMHGISVEAELGHVGEGQAILSEEEQKSRLTRVDEARRFIEETGVDVLAVSIGTLHGLYRGKPHLDFERLAQLRAACPLPLVLHGGSNNPDEDMRRAIEIGIDKINVWTDVRIPFLQAIKAALQAATAQTEIHQIMRPARDAAREVVRQKNRLFGSCGKSSLYR